MDLTPTQVAEPPAATKLPLPQPLHLEQPEWTVIVRDGVPYAALDLSRGYPAEARDWAEVLRWTREAAWQLRYYRGDAQPAPQATPTPKAAAPALPPSPTPTERPHWVTAPLPVRGH